MSVDRPSLLTPASITMATGGERMQVACCKLEEVMVCCLIAAIQQQTALSVSRQIALCTLRLQQYVEAAG